MLSSSDRQSLTRCIHTGTVNDAALVMHPLPLMRIPWSHKFEPHATRESGERQGGYRLITPYTRSNETLLRSPRGSFPGRPQAVEQTISPAVHLFIYGTVH